MNSYFSDCCMSKCYPQHPLPRNRAGLWRDPHAGQEMEAPFIHQPPPRPHTLETRRVTLEPKPVPIPRPRRAGGDQQVGAERFSWPWSCLQLPGWLRRRWLGCATERAQHHQCPPSPAEDFGKSFGKGWAGASAVPDTPKHWGKAHQMFPWHLGPGEMSFWAYCLGLIPSGI